MASIGITCGPTGGHLIPGLLLSNKFRELGHNVTLYSTCRPSYNLLKGFDGNYRRVNVSPWAGQSLPGKVTSLAEISEQIPVLMGEVRDMDAVVGFGGYSSIPLLVSAWLADTPIFIQEQNRVVGRGNRLFKTFAVQWYFGFPPVDVNYKSYGLLTGNPIRRMDSINDSWFEESPVLMVMGGSQGARSLSRALRDHLDQLRNIGWKVFYVKGKFGLDIKQGKYENLDFVRQVEFTRELPAYLQVADCVWSRAGAGSLHEIMYYDVPAVFFPLQSSADNHQVYNARWVSGPAVIEGSSLIKQTTELASSEKRVYQVPWDKTRRPETTIARDVLQWIGK
ncbi:MAG: UDP-N-acetylglucosamine--N-acetylmuramyl-(pentapeptide) pyrophosphoryl-undecaprenol N-acetylglucosamine transferase [bacterium]